MVNSILTSTKASLGLAESHTAFDVELIMHINSVLSDLHQIGVGPAEGLEIESAAEEWEALTYGDARLNGVKSYMYQRVKLLFDPPDIGFVLTAMKEQIEKTESRLMMATDPPYVPAVVVEPSDVVMDGGVI